MCVMGGWEQVAAEPQATCNLQCASEPSETVLSGELVGSVEFVDEVQCCPAPEIRRLLHSFNSIQFVPRSSIPASSSAIIATGGHGTPSSPLIHRLSLAASSAMSSANANNHSTSGR